MIFVPDCPLYTLLLTAVLILHKVHKKNTILSTITYIGLIKYGFWTILTVLLYRDQFFTQDPLLYSILFVLHIGMIIESSLIPDISKFTKKALMIALTWFLVNDIMDYFGGTLPYIPNTTYFNLLAIESFLMTIILVIYSKKNVS